MKDKKPLTPQEAFVKAASYCAYQERCHQEVQEKLQTFGLKRDEIDEVISRLIEENFLNEERFAKAFAGGKFRVKKWGRLKIKHALQQKDVSEYSIRKGLQEIDPNDYYATLVELAESKREQLKDKNARQALYTYLAGKGFEPNLIQEVIGDLEV